MSNPSQIMETRGSSPWLSFFSAHFKSRFLLSRGSLGRKYVLISSKICRLLGKLVGVGLSVGVGGGGLLVGGGLSVGAGGGADLN